MGRRDIAIREVRSSCCPPTSATHRNDRVTGSVGLVIERPARPGRSTASSGTARECHALVHRGEVSCGAWCDDLPKAFAAFYDDEGARTCPSCGWVTRAEGALPDPPLAEDALRQEAV